MEICELIKAAKIGAERKAAQIDTCAAFAAALYDVLSEEGFLPKMIAVCHLGATIAGTWYHQVVAVDGKMYDSLGEFSTEILRKRLKIHPSCAYELTYANDRRQGCYHEDDFQDIYEFLVTELRRAARRLTASTNASVMR